jgi:hypothetical protein
MATTFTPTVMTTLTIEPAIMWSHHPAPRFQIDRGKGEPQRNAFYF